jgi:hypothetical protein
LNKRYADIREFPQREFPLVCAIQTRSLTMAQLVIALGADPQKNNKKNMHYRGAVFLEKIQIKKITR